MPRKRCLPAMLGLALTAGPALIAAESDSPSTPRETTPDTTADNESGQQDRRPFLGITIAADEAGAAFDARGVLIDSVIVGSTADTLGLAVGDRLLSLNDTAVANAADLERAAREIGVGADLSIELERKGEQQTLTGTMQAFPSKEIWERLVEEQRETKRDLGNEVATATREANQRRWRNLVLAGVVRRTADALAALPGRIETATREYKRVYPGGDFDIRLNVHIASRPEQVEPSAAPSDAEPDETAEADDAASGAETDDDQTPETDDADAQTVAEDTTPGGPRAAGRRTRRFSTAAQQTGAATLATAMAELASALEELPGALQETTRDFKQAYPDGVFRIDVAVSIVPDPDAEDVLRLGPGTDETANDEPAKNGEEPAAGDGEPAEGDEQEQKPDTDATDD
ncbi:MAG: PDZ domain-containing protein [Planctomycetota bacterium]